MHKAGQNGRKMGAIFLKTLSVQLVPPEMQLRRICLRGGAVFAMVNSSSETKEF